MVQKSKEHLSLSLKDYQFNLPTTVIPNVNKRIPIGTAKMMKDYWVGLKETNRFLLRT